MSGASAGAFQAAVDGARQHYTPQPTQGSGLFTGIPQAIPNAAAQNPGLAPMAMYNAYRMGATPGQLNTMNQYAQPSTQGQASNVPSIAQTPFANAGQPGAK